MQEAPRGRSWTARAPWGRWLLETGSPDCRVGARVAAVEWAERCGLRGRGAGQTVLVGAGPAGLAWEGLGRPSLGPGCGLVTDEVGEALGRQG